MRPMNLLILMSDEHNRQMMGCSGHPVVQTPNLDRLAGRGALFPAAYCNCPICVPSRASMATGRYVHELRLWDNATPYVGEYPSWGHRLTAAGRHVTTIGKLHYRTVGDDVGFPDQRMPMNVKDGVGDLYSLIREDMAPRPQARARLLEAGPGESSYVRYDRQICEAAEHWLTIEAAEHEEPWALFVSFVSPHFPLIAPQEYLDLYPPESVVLPRASSLADRPKHPVLEEMRRVFAIDDELDEMQTRKAVASYYALCTFLDSRIGRVLAALEAGGHADDTRIIYTSDHGDTVGDHGLWWKHTMYESSAGVPLILAGPDIPASRVVEEPVSLVDFFPTILEATGVSLEPEDDQLPGTSLLPLARGAGTPEGDGRVVFGEYHAAGAVTALFMIRDGQYKYVHYVGYPPQLFDLRNDPHEDTDLAADPDYAQILASCEQELREICDPEEVDRLARADQARMLAEHGGKDAVLSSGYQIPYTPVPREFIE